MTSRNKDYQALLQISRHIKILGGVSNLLHWDQETYMPSGAANIRAEQLEALSEIIHKEATGSKFSTALGKMVSLKDGTFKSKSLNPREKAALLQWRRDYNKAKALPTKFVKEFTKLSSQGLQAWRSARSENSFQRFAPFLERIIDKSREKAELYGYKEHPYDALLDDYEPEITSREISTLFQGVRKSIVQLLGQISKAKQVDSSFLSGKFDHEKQMAFSKQILQEMGYDMTRGRLDFSTHPFSISTHPTDSRITTRIHNNSLMDCLSAVMHECGHSLYEMGLPQDEFGSPLCESVSLGIHESQSRWWETRIGQSKPFWKHYLPLLKKTFKGKLDDVSLVEFYRAVNKVQPSFIRVEADEVTYPLHVILRFEIEKELIEGSMQVRDIPEAWNARMKSYLGITPPNDAQGCLQDIHWAMGGFGYFSTYTLGNMFAAQFFDAFEKDYPTWKEQVSQGHLSFIKEWLNKQIHQYGRQYSSKELIKKVTGKAFSSEPYLRYLNDKYKEIYSLGAKAR